MKHILPIAALFFCYVIFFFSAAVNRDLRMIPKTIALTQTTPLTVNVESGKTAELSVKVEEYK
jgi:hypothetical protein